MISHAETRARAGEINITPLVDVVLVLLLIFMVVSPMPLNEVPVTVPQKSLMKMTSRSLANQIIVEVTAQGGVALGGEPVSRTALVKRVHDLLSTRDDKSVFFSIDDRAIYGEAMHVMDLCRGAGATGLGLVRP